MWADHAACVSPQVDLDWFFPATFDDGPRGGASYANARSVCERCPVAVECLDAAMVEERGKGSIYRHGMRGGLTPRQRVRLARGLPVARPEKPAALPPVPAIKTTKRPALRLANTCIGCTARIPARRVRCTTCAFQTVHGGQPATGVA